MIESRGVIEAAKTANEERRYKRLVEVAQGLLNHIKDHENELRLLTENLESLNSGSDEEIDRVLKLNSCSVKYR